MRNESKSVSAANMQLMSVWFHHTKHTSWEERVGGERRGEKRGEAERGRKEGERSALSKVESLGRGGFMIVGVMGLTLMATL